MIWLTEDAVIICSITHATGIVQLKPSQKLVTISGRCVLVEIDPENKPIKGCPNIITPMKPCTKTLQVEKGYSDLIRIQNKRVCLDTVTGKTDGTPPGTVMYVVTNPGQKLVDQP